MSLPFVIGVAGGSGSGKTTVTRRVVDTVWQGGVAVLNQDNYYRNQDDIPFEARLKTNYDHPAAFDWTLLRQHIDALLSGVPIDMPEYDFTRHRSWSWRASSRCTTRRCATACT